MRVHETIKYSDYSRFFFQTIHRRRPYVEPRKFVCHHLYLHFLYIIFIHYYECTYRHHTTILDTIMGCRPAYQDLDYHNSFLFTFIKRSVSNFKLIFFYFYRQNSMPVKRQVSQILALVFLCTKRISD